MTAMNCNDQQFLGLDPAAQMALTRRTFLTRSASGLGLAALGSLMDGKLFANTPERWRAGRISR
jgi:hypothetical protein